MLNWQAKSLIPTLLTLGMIAAAPIKAAPLNISDTPLFLTQSVAPITMIVMGRDHRLYYEAYNDASDLNNDGTINVGYNPTITYFGYFNSNTCYSYSGGQFNPSSTTATKKCSGAWSGDFLNYLTMTRIDALRKVLYGGFRSTDSNGNTVLQRTALPQDAHSFGKEYLGPSTCATVKGTGNLVTCNGYALADYTPLSAPIGNNNVLFANTTRTSGGPPLLRVTTQPYRIWEWVSIERPVADNAVSTNGSTKIAISGITDYTVRNRVCVTGLLESNCRVYPNGNYKPIGLLQEFGENDQMKFGLLTGSYTKNKSGGVLRKNIGSITDEINSNTGIFTSTAGIIKTLDRLSGTIGFNYASGQHLHSSNCGFIFSRDFLEGECRLWGNPVGEMMYETLRYFAGKGSPTSAFNYGSGGDDNTLNLPKPSWQNPYDAANNPRCAKPSMLVISDINVSYDSDQIPGSYFSSFTGDLSPALNAQVLGSTIWNSEFGSSASHFIGQSATNNDGTPSAKTVTSLGNIRGLTPEEPNKEGSYYAASTAYYGKLNDLNSAQGDQKTSTFVVALNTPLPEINIPVGSQTVRIIPFGKSVGPAPPNCLGGINPASGAFQPTNTIVDFYVEEITATSGKFRINFEDAQQGADHDMDAIVEYEYSVSGNTVTVTLTSDYAAGCIIQHMGYVISGTTADGVYLEVRDSDTSAGNDIDYFLDTPNTAGVALPLTTTRVFTVGSSSSATLLKNPLWFAAKWGGFNDENNNDIPDLADEWDQDADGVPDNYFLVVNPLNLRAQLEKAFESILAQASSAASAAVSNGVLTATTKIYQVIFDSTDWSGQLLAFSLDPVTGDLITTGSGPNGSLWDAGDNMTTRNPNTREIITFKPSNNRGIKFDWPSNPASPGANDLDLAQIAFLNTSPISGLTDSLGEQRLEYIRGDNSNEQQNGGTFRDRATDLGDIIGAAPLYVGPPAFPYRDLWPSGSAENGVAYSAYKFNNASRTPVLYFGANAGLFHAVNGNTGVELLAYVPSEVYADLNKLTDPDYAHKFFVDGPPNMGDVFYDSAWHTVLASGLNNGGQGVFALDITNPSQFTETNAQSLVLWEFNDDDDADLGFTYSQPAIPRMRTTDGAGVWTAVFGNGYNNTFSDGPTTTSSTGNAALYIVNIKTGALIKKLDTGVGTAQDPLGLGRPNGLSTPIAVDTNGDFVADYIYAGDLFGNLWKFDVTDNNPANWAVAFSGQPLFTAQYNASDITTRQPITVRPTAVKPGGVLNSVTVYFGTGKFLENSDKTDTSVQTFYAVTDTHTTPIAKTDLLEQTIVQEVTSAGGGTYRITSNNVQTSSHRGWYMNMIMNNNPLGERVISWPVVRGDRVIFVTIIPSTDPCAFGGISWLMELDLTDGSYLSETPFDVNGDGLFNNADFFNINNELIPAGGKLIEVGISSTPTIISSGNIEHKYLAGSSGQIEHVVENPGSQVGGRQSWRQLR